MLCATADVKSPAANSSDEAERNCILGDVMGGGWGGLMIVVISVVARAEPPAKRDKLAIIHKLGAFAVGSAGPATLGGADRVLSRRLDEFCEWSGIRGLG